MKIPFLPRISTAPPLLSPILPPRPPLQSSSTFKLFITGGLVGPVVDSLHNQCLLEYDRAPISIAMPQQQQLSTTMITTTAESTTGVVPYLFCSSWYIPLLLGVAYVVLGDVLPRIIKYVFEQVAQTNEGDDISTTSSRIGSNNNGDKAIINEREEEEEAKVEVLRNKAILAVSSTALIIKLSDFLQTHSYDDSLLIMSIASLLQWALLDGTLISLITASIVSVGGPLSELPFVASGFWHYIPSAADYLPLADIITIDAADNILIGGRIVEFEFLRQYRDLALSSITGPCYFAVTMDAIALGRWFNSQ